MGSASHTKYRINGGCHNINTAYKVCHRLPRLCWFLQHQFPSISFSCLYARTAKCLHVCLTGKSVSFLTVHGSMVMAAWFLLPGSSHTLSCLQTSAHNFKTSVGSASLYLVRTTRVITRLYDFLPYWIELPSVETICAHGNIPDTAQRQTQSRHFLSLWNKLKSVWHLDKICST